MLKNRQRQLLSFFIVFSLGLPSYALEKTPESAATLSAVPDYSSHLGEVLITLLAIIALIFFLAWCVKRLGYVGGQHNHGLSMKACLPLSNKEKLMVVQVGNQQVLIGVAPGGISHIADLNEHLATSDQSSPTPPTTFANSLSHFIKKQTSNKEKK